MELWMKIAFAVMAVMSVMGLTAFILVVRLMWCNKPDEIVHGFGTRQHSGRYPLGYSQTIEGRVAKLEANSDYERNRRMDTDNRVNDIWNDTEKKLRKLKKRVKDIEDFMHM